MDKDKLKIDFFPQDPDDINDCDCCCERSKDVTFDSCEQFKDITIDDVVLKCQGRLLKVDVKLDRVCPGRDVNVGVLVCDEDCNNSTIKGFRACTLCISSDLSLGKGKDDCVDNVSVGPFCFVIPDENLCDEKDLKVHVIAHYTNLGPCPCE